MKRFFVLGIFMFCSLLGLSQCPEEIVWANLVACEVDTENNQLLSLESGWNNGATSEQTIPIDKDATISFAVTQTNKRKMIGLSEQDLEFDPMNAHYSTIDYKIYLQPNGTWRLYMPGEPASERGDYNIGDVFQIKVDRNAGSFRVTQTNSNGSLVLPEINVNLIANAELIVDVSMLNANTIIPNIELSVGVPTIYAKDYLNGDEPNITEAVTEAIYDGLNNENVSQVVIGRDIDPEWAVGPIIIDGDLLCNPNMKNLEIILVSKLVPDVIYPFFVDGEETNLNLNDLTLPVNQEHRHISLLHFENVDYVTINGNGMTVDMSNLAVKNYEWRHAISVFSCENLSVVDLSISNLNGGDGIYIGRKNNDARQNNIITIDHVVVNNAYRNGIAVISGKDILIEDCEINNIGWINDEGTIIGSNRVGIDIEPNFPKDNVEVEINNNCISNCLASGVALSIHYALLENPVDVIVTNTDVDNSGYGIAYRCDNETSGIFQINDMNITSCKRGMFVSKETCVTVDAILNRCNVYINNPFALGEGGYFLLLEGNSIICENENFITFDACTYSNCFGHASTNFVYTGLCQDQDRLNYNTPITSFTNQPWGNSNNDEICDVSNFIANPIQFEQIELNENPYFKIYDLPNDNLSIKYTINGVESYFSGQYIPLASLGEHCLKVVVESCNEEYDYSCEELCFYVEEGEGNTCPRDFRVSTPEIVHAECGNASGSITISSVILNCEEMDFDDLENFKFNWSHVDDDDPELGPHVEDLVDGEYCVTITPNIGNCTDCKIVKCFDVLKSNGCELPFYCLNHIEARVAEGNEDHQIVVANGGSIDLASGCGTDFTWFENGNEMPGENGSSISNLTEPGQYCVEYLNINSELQNINCRGSKCFDIEYCFEDQGCKICTKPEEEINPRNHSELNSFKIYPNPSRDKINLSLSGSLIEFSVFDMEGNRLLQKSVSQERTLAIDLEGLMNGLYIIRGRFEGGEVQHSKFIKL